jgi:PAS domain S-box-containing protein
VDALEFQIASALQRFSALQQEQTPERNGQTKLFRRALRELETALEELRVAQQQLVEGRHHLEQIQAELVERCGKYWQLFNDMPQGYVVTRGDSTITEANRAAAELFNVSQRFLVGKTMSLFVCEDRADFLASLGFITPGQAPRDMHFRLRPRERAPLDVSARVAGDGHALRWILQSARTEVPAA